MLTSGSGAGNFDLSDAGALVYVQGNPRAVARRVVWVHPDGREEPLPLPARRYLDPRVSPGGRRIAVRRAEQWDLWVYDAVSGAELRLTQDYRVQGLVWTPDGSRIIFGSSHEGGVHNIYSVLADGSAQPELVLASDTWDLPTSIAPNGRMVAFTRLPSGPGTSHREIWEVAISGEEPPKPLLQGDVFRGNAEYSPDGNWLLYESNQSGAWEVYVQPYPGPGPVLRASIGGGNDAMWSVDGSRLFYRLGDRMMAAPFDSSDPVPIGSPTVVFAGAYVGNPGGIRQHHVAPDGRFLMIKRFVESDDDAESPPQINVVLNWFEELKRLVPSD